MKTIPTVVNVPFALRRRSSGQLSTLTRVGQALGLDTGASAVCQSF